MRALVVDDDLVLARLVQRWLEHLAVEVSVAGNGREALALYDAKPYDLVMSDLVMPDMGGQELLTEIKARDPLVPVVIMTAVDSTEMAVNLLRLGADDYLVKPFRQRALLARLDSIIEKAQRLNDARILRETGRDETLPRFGLIGDSPGVRQMLNRVRLFARTDAPVLVTGESGTGKELIARAIHRQSPRAKGPFVAVNCGSIPTTLFESQFFGHRKGAFSDASRDHQGFIAEAENGSLFLDEVGELPPSTQAALLRVLQEHEYRPLGDTKSYTANVRILAATNRDLARRVTDGGFREDLFYRLNVLTIETPPLRERSEDVPALAQHFLETLQREWGSQARGIDPLALAALRAYRWPGNIRELQNCMQRAAAMTEGEVIGLEQLPENVRNASPSDAVVLAANVAGAVAGNNGGHAANPAIKLDVSFHEAKQRVVEAFERQYLLRQLEANKGNVSAAARAAGLDRKSYWRLLKKYR